MKRRSFFSFLGAATAAPLIPKAAEAAKAVEEFVEVPAKIERKPLPGLWVDEGATAMPGVTARRHYDYFTAACPVVHRKV